MTVMMVEEVGYTSSILPSKPKSPNMVMLRLNPSLPPLSILKLLYQSLVSLPIILAPSVGSSAYCWAMLSKALNDAFSSSAN
jgi:hypothetical protein